MSAKGVTIPRSQLAKGPIIHVRHAPFVTKESRSNIDVITQSMRIKPDIRKKCGLIKHGWTDAVEGMVEAC